MVTVLLEYIYLWYSYFYKYLAKHFLLRNNNGDCSIRVLIIDNIFSQTLPIMLASGIMLDVLATYYA